MNSHSSSLMKVCSFTKAVSTLKLRRGGTHATTGSACSQKMMLYATRICANTSETSSGTKKQSPAKLKRRVTSSTSQPTSVLFDKGVIGRVYERWVRLVMSKPPTVLQRRTAHHLYVTHPSTSVLFDLAAEIVLDCRLQRECLR